MTEWLLDIMKVDVNAVDRFTRTPLEVRGRLDLATELHSLHLIKAGHAFRPTASPFPAS